MAIVILTYGATKAQITVDPNPTPQQVIDFLQGADITLSNLTITCDTNALGFFDGTNSNIGIPQGFAMTTGSMDSLIGPNLSGSTSNNLELPGDSNLNAYAGANTYDACIIEFDAVPEHGALLFDFAFGSEEYPEWVSSGFNDVFAVYGSGTGINGLVNYALVPGTNLPVSIDNINAGTNSAYYVDNIGGQTVAYDGFTTVLTGFINVQPFETYHFKIAIADAGDGIYDSGVFFTWYSFRSSIITEVEEILNKPQVYPNPIDNSAFINLENLNLDQYQFRLTNLSGQIVMEETRNDKRFTFNRNGIPAGIYIAEFTGNGNVYREKLVLN